MQGRRNSESSRATASLGATEAWVNEAVPELRRVGKGIVMVKRIGQNAYMGEGDPPTKPPPPVATTAELWADAKDSVAKSAWKVISRLERENRELRRALQFLTDSEARHGCAYACDQCDEALTIATNLLLRLGGTA